VRIQFISYASARFLASEEISAHGVMCEYLGVLATVRARKFWMCWSLFIWVLGRLKYKELQ